MFTSGDRRGDRRALRTFDLPPAHFAEKAVLAGVRSRQSARLISGAGRIMIIRRVIVALMPLLAATSVRAAEQ
jgi:hypothetical protein